MVLDYNGHQAEQQQEDPTVKRRRKKAIMAFLSLGMNLKLKPTSESLQVSLPGTKAAMWRRLLGPVIGAAALRRVVTLFLPPAAWVAVEGLAILGLSQNSFLGLSKGFPLPPLVCLLSAPIQPFALPILLHSLSCRLLPQFTLLPPSTPSMPSSHDTATSSTSLEDDSRDPSSEGPPATSSSCRYAVAHDNGREDSSLDPLSRMRRQLRETMSGGEDVLLRFLRAAKGDVQKCEKRVEEHVRWRSTFPWMNEEELATEWAPLVHWHNAGSFVAEDKIGALYPTLVIHFGAASRSLCSRGKKDFMAAIVSTMEHGVRAMSFKAERGRERGNGADAEEEARKYAESGGKIAVVVDCRGVGSIWAMPLPLMKDCALLLHKNFPSRLEVLFAVHVPPVLRWVAAAITQVVSEGTRRKIQVLGASTTAMDSVLACFGGRASVPRCLSGGCFCQPCRHFLPQTPTPPPVITASSLDAESEAGRVDGLGLPVFAADLCDSVMDPTITHEYPEQEVGSTLRFQRIRSYLLLSILTIVVFTMLFSFYH